MRTACIPSSGLLLLSGLFLAAAWACTDAPTFTGTGEEIFHNQCAVCHMRDGTGSQSAPTLRGKKVHWTREALVTYLKDPAATIAKDPRLKAQGRKYSQPMPTYKMLPQTALESLADHVLSLPE